MRFWHTIALCLCLVIAINTIGCGTLLYPERKGQTGGEVDSKVVIMDGLLCLLFIIPGVVAFVVDIDNGCIYLPGGYGELQSPAELAQILPHLKLQFVNDQGQMMSEPLPVEQVNGQSSKFKALAQTARLVKIYYHDQQIHSVALANSTVAEK